jgi:predicted transcriptional regulator
MATKRTYSVRLDDEQRRLLEARANAYKAATGELIRTAIREYLRQEEEKDYLSEVEARIATTINRLSRQVEKDRVEQQLVMGVLDYLREWLAFTLPSPPDKAKANDLMLERNNIFYERLQHSLASSKTAKITAYMQTTDRWSEPCPQCGTGRLKSKQGEKRLFWYCTNWNASPKCDARFADDAGYPLLSATENNGK